MSLGAREIRLWNAIQNVLQCSFIVMRIEFDLQVVITLFPYLKINKSIVRGGITIREKTVGLINLKVGGTHSEINRTYQNLT